MAESPVSKMETIEKDIQKKLVSFCKTLPLHVDLWKKVLQEIQDPLTALANFAEQLRYVEKADVKYIDDFSLVQKELQTKILFHIEEELEEIKLHIDKLNRSNHDLKNKLATFERATIDLDWDLNSRLIKGSPTQPRLDKLLQMGFEFWTFFSDTLKSINGRRRTLNIRDRKSVEDFQKSFSIRLEPQDGCNKVYGILALTQYVIIDKDLR